jgi:hypothetical protein
VAVSENLTLREVHLAPVHAPNMALTYDQRKLLETGRGSRGSKLTLCDTLGLASVIVKDFGSWNPEKITGLCWIRYGTR